MHIGGWIYNLMKKRSWNDCVKKSMHVICFYIDLRVLK